jgi:hypothetical protein
MAKATQKTLAQLHDKVAKKLLKMIESEEATPQDLAQAIKFLKDNNVLADVELSTTLQQLEDRVDISTLPFPIKSAQ